MEGSKVFVPDAKLIWLPAEITSVNGSIINVRLEDVFDVKQHSTLGEFVGKSRVVDLSDEIVVKTISTRTVKKAQNSISLPLQNQQRGANGFDDMITLDHLHEGAILYNVRHRFFNHIPYTYTGKICIAVNPYQWLGLYTSTVMNKYLDTPRASVPPHVYATSSEAFNHMRKYSKNQSILVSGESGAGKTETTKIVMSHLAKLSVGSDKDNSDVIRRIIESNPLLESFGNAKTVRNDNSSRFGKFTELQFNSTGALIGARSRTYLLEKSRVTKQSAGERNFHIFYQLMSKSKDYIHLKLKDNFRYLRPDETINQEDMAQHFQRTLNALRLINIDADTTVQLINVIASILHLGEVVFDSPSGDVDKSQCSQTEPLNITSELVGVSPEALEKVLCNRNVVVGRECYLKPMTTDQAADCRDGLAKALFSRLFLWLVGKINEAISVSDHKTSHFVGILDIFGFEHFRHNSFEQLCINYANEKLQQKFVQDILKTVQAEYEEEGITWSHITFADNQDVLNLIEGRLGVISLLNEESLLATGTDAAFAHKLAAVTENNPLLETPRLNRSAFTIHHYAGKVTYDTKGFLEKHRDAILPDIVTAMSSSSSEIVASMFAVEVSSNSSKRHAKKGKMQSTTVGTQFRQSLAELMDKITQTNVHYIRCIKPNSVKSPHVFEHEAVVNQLRYAGVIEAIRVSRSAYPSRVAHRECIMKYSILLDGGVKNIDTYRHVTDTKPICEDLMNTLIPNGNIKDYQVGATRVYFREGVLEDLEAKRGIALRGRAILIQKNVRGYVKRKVYQRKRNSAVKVQSILRLMYHRFRYLKLRSGVLILQSRIRGAKARRDFQDLKKFRRAAVIQAGVRSYLRRRSFVKKRQAVITIQSFVRMTISRCIYVRRLEQEKKHKAMDSMVERLQSKLNVGTTRSGSSGSDGDATMHRNSAERPSYATTKGLFNESSEVLGALKHENEQMRSNLESQLEEISALKNENRKLREWQKTKEVDERVKSYAHREQEAKDLAYLSALEKEYSRLRLFMIEAFSLPPDTGALPERDTNRRGSVEGQDSGRPPLEKQGSSIVTDGVKLERLKSLDTPELDGRTSENFEELRHAASVMLTRCSGRLGRAKTRNAKGSARRVKDYWEEIKNFPPPMQYTLGSVPWKRLLADWAQGNPKKLDYMTKWLKNVLSGGPIQDGPFPMGVELKSVTPMMLDGFMQLVIPKLAERQDINVHVHTKEFIGTSMRITLAIKDGNNAKGGGMVDPDSRVQARVMKAKKQIEHQRISHVIANNDRPSQSFKDEDWGRGSIRSVR